jgi:hypothetical protein
MAWPRALRRISGKLTIPVNSVVVAGIIVLAMVLFVFMGERPPGRQWKPSHDGHLRMWVRCLVLPVLFLAGVWFIFGVPWPSEAGFWMDARGLLWFAVVVQGGRSSNARCAVGRW